MSTNCAAMFLRGVLFYMTFMKFLKFSKFSVVCTSVLPLIPCLTWCDASARQTICCWASALTWSSPHRVAAFQRLPVRG